MLNDRLAQLIARKFSGELTAAEMQELQSSLEAHPDVQTISDVLDYCCQSPAFEMNDFESDERFQRIIKKAEEEKLVEEAQLESFELAAQRHRKLAVFGPGSAIAVILGLIAIVYFFLKPEAKEQNVAIQKNDIVARPGAKTHFQLPDGSRVWLNSKSRLTYKESFNDNIREAELEGEAFFDVIKDTLRPFIIHTLSGIDIRVLGTAFNVKAYPDDAFAEATLLSGLLEVININEPKAPKVLLQPHHKMVFRKGEMQKARRGIFAISNDTLKRLPAIDIVAVPVHLPDSVLKETAWVYNKLIFDDDSFRELALKMERWFNVRIHFKSEKVAKYSLHGSFENETIVQALDALQLIASFTYKINGNEIEIDNK
jgi:ferric-dicitrate binding protein FerR (iron transport regulator)